MSFKHLSRGALMATLPVLLLLPGCAGLNLHLYRAAAQKPGQVALYFSVETRGGEPVGGLDATSFKIYEDEQLISPYESKQTILNPEVAVVHYTVLLLDLSGSITESGSTEALVAAAGAFADRITRREQVAIYGFDGSPKLIPLAGFSNSGPAVARGLRGVASRRARDPSTNLNGAVVEAVDVLEQAIQRAKQPLAFGTLVVFTDGTDRAHRVAERDMLERLDQSTLNVFAIGLGPEMSLRHLSHIGRDGFIRAEQVEQVGTAFDEVARRIENSARKYYLLSYCSPSRAGQHRLQVVAHQGTSNGWVTHEFVADGFGPGCNSTRPPRFPSGAASQPSR